MKRIAILHPTDPQGNVPGGIDSFIKGILKHAPADLEYTLFGASSDTTARPLDKIRSVPAAQNRDARFVPIVATHPSSTRGKIPLSIRYILALRRRIREGVLKEFDILDFHRIEPVLLFRRDNRPKNVILHADYAILRDKQSDIMWRHWPWLYERLEAHAFQKLDRIFAVRQTAVERYSKIYPEISHKFSFIPTWMDPSTFHPPSSPAERRLLRDQLIDTLRISSTSQLLVFVGRLDHQKDPLLLLAALRLALNTHPNIHLIMIGDGILRSEVKTFCRARGLKDRVTLLGVRSASEIADILRSSDLFVLSSAYEGMCIAVLEALAVGLPVASTQVGEIDLVLKSGVNGNIAPSRTPDALAGAIIESLDRLDDLSGVPCQKAVLPYHPERVLARIYENHSIQSSLRQGAR